MPGMFEVPKTVKLDYVYDIESLRNFFCAGFLLLDADRPVAGYMFEISSRKNEARELYEFLLTYPLRLIGFNNMSYDWPMLAHFIQLYEAFPFISAEMMREKNDEIFATPFNDRYRHVIWNPQIPQIDLFMLHHLDRWSVSLKQIEFAMRSKRVQDMPIDPNEPVPVERFDEVLDYNIHDIGETAKFALRSVEAIQFRETLGPEWLNYNDGKIGKKFFENELKKAGVKLYNPDRSKRQTPRLGGVVLGDIILPRIRFTRPENTAVLKYIAAQRILPSETRGGLTVTMSLDGFDIDVGLGGIHGSLKRAAIDTSTGTIHDVDVTSYYPSIAIVHRIFPEHLGPAFCDIYAALKARRIALDKSDPARTMLKFALNVPFGDSNSEHGIFYDPAYMMAITINGQLMLCMLAEQFANVPGVRLIQVNTDGVTIQYGPTQKDKVYEICRWWQQYTGMDLEDAFYRRMYIRDVGSYIAEDVQGKRKRKGDYDHNKGWHQDHSSLIIPRAAEAAMFDDSDIEEYITTWNDPYDFMIFKKGNLELTNGTKLDRRQRYYISTTGHGLAVVHKPLKGKTTPRRIGIHAEGLAEAIPTGLKGKGVDKYRCSECDSSFKLKDEFDIHNKHLHTWKVQPCNNFDGLMPNNVDYRYYIREAEKLVID